MKGRIYRIIAALSVAAVCFASCKGGERPAPAKEELVILCGSSFVPPTDEIIRRFKAETGAEVVTTSAGSEDFLPLVKTGKKGDILVTHDPYLDYVKDAGAYMDSAEVGFLVPALAVAKGNPKGIRSIGDLAREGLRVGLTDPQYSTCGEMVFSLLEKKGIKAAVLKNVGNRLTKGHSSLGTLLQTGAVDAVIMWKGVAYTFRDDLDIVETPYEYDSVVGVHVIGLNYSRVPELAESFIRFAGEHGASVFESYGYVK